MGSRYSLQLATPDQSPTWPNNGIVSINIPPGVMQGNLEDGLVVDLTIPMTPEIFQPSPVPIQNGSSAPLRQSVQTRSRSQSRPRSRSRSAHSGAAQSESDQVVPTPPSGRSSRSTGSRGRVSQRSNPRSSRAINRHGRSPRQQRLRRRAINVYEQMTTPVHSGREGRTPPMSLDANVTRQPSLSPQMAQNLTSETNTTPRLPTPRPVLPKALFQGHSMEIDETLPRSNLEERTLSASLGNSGMSTAEQRQIIEEVGIAQRYFRVRNRDLDTLRRVIQRMMQENESGGATFNQHLNQWLENQ